MKTVGVNKRFATAADRRNIPYERLVKAREELYKQRNMLIEKSKKANKFGGKRFLGTTVKGKDVYVKYIIKRNDMSIKIEFSVNPKGLLKEGAKLANNRYSWRIGDNVNKDSSHMTSNLNTRKSQSVTKNTIHWIKRLQILSDIKFDKAYDKNKITYGLFREIASAIYTGFDNYDKINMTSIGHAWEFPSKSEYYNIEEAWSYPDEL